MNNVAVQECGLGVSSRSRRCKAPALIDRDVDDDGAWHHRADHFFLKLVLVLLLQE